MIIDSLISDFLSYIHNTSTIRYISMTFSVTIRPSQIYCSRERLSKTEATLVMYLNKLYRAVWNVFDRSAQEHDVL